jgi:hypothetical protein
MDFTPLTKVAQTKTYPASHKLCLNQDKSTYTCGEQEQLAQHCNHDKFSSKVEQKSFISYLYSP